MKKNILVLSGIAVLALGACTSMPDMSSNYVATKNAHYWQRTDASSAIYQRGPKAQQMLQRDIAKCVYQVRELQRLGAINAAIPADATINGSPIPDPKTAQGRLADQDSPSRDGYLYAEQSDFHDFETCMKEAGWDRVEYLPYSQAKEDRTNYINAILQERRASNGAPPALDTPPPKPYSNLNQ